jgi:glutamate carboxypeptidase
MITALRELVNLESPSHDKGAVDSCSAYLTRALEKMGSRIITFPQVETGDFFLAEYPGVPRIKDKRQRSLILVHTDTVWPLGTLSHRPFSVDRDRASGPGVLDMKSGLVMVLFAWKALHDLNLTPAHHSSVFINSCEEVGGAAADEAILKAAGDSARVLCLEPSLPGGALKLRRKGRLVVRIEAEGCTAHAGSPEQGVSALDELMVQLRALNRLKSRSLTINTGLMQGGHAVNAVADRAWALLDIRFWTRAQELRIREHIRTASPVNAGARISWQLERETAPMEHTTASARLLRRARRIAGGMELRLPAGRTGGGSDASLASQLGIPTLDGLGPEGGGIHADDEHVLLASLFERTALLTRLLLEL